MSESVVKEMSPMIHLFSPTECPWNMVDSAAWGLLDEEAFVQHWLLNNPDDEATRLTSKHLLHSGRGGVRHMNAFEVFKRGRESALPISNPLEIAMTFAQHHCEKHVKSSEEKHTNLSYANHFRDVLFPVVQGVPENRAKVFCLRYVMELATYLAMRHVISIDDVETVIQLEVVEDWKRKCHTQTKLLGFCALRNVFSAHRVSAEDGGVLHNHAECAGIFFIGEENMKQGDSFVVSGSSCLSVYHSTRDNIVRILDPCRVIHNCHGTKSKQTNVHVTDFIKENHFGIAVLDPLTFLSNRSHTLSLKWSSATDPHWKSIQETRDLYAEKHQTDALNSEAAGLNIKKLWEKYIRPESQPDVPTATLTEPWHTVSGLRGEDDASSCGGVSDWWPEEWEHPVGFHVTTPCGHTSVGNLVDYHTFNNH